MNFETRYLIRWGVPGWIFIIIIVTYFSLDMRLNDPGNTEIFESVINNAPQILAVAALLIIIGIPIGYLLNQMHHVWIWVIRVDWEKYFKLELKLNTVFFNKDVGNEINERYKYLLARVHELGSILVGLVVSITVIIIHACIHSFSTLSLLFILITFLIYVVILISRNYYRKNLDAFTKYYGDGGSFSVRNNLFKWLHKKRERSKKWLVNFIIKK